MWTVAGTLILAASISATQGYEKCSLKAGQDGYWHIKPFGGGWVLFLPADGAGRLVIHNSGGDRHRSVIVDAEARKALNEALGAADFMGLEDPALDWIVADEDTGEIRVQCGAQVNAVRFGDTPSRPTPDSPERVERFRRALRVWSAARSLFDDEQAVDTRRRDMCFLAGQPCE